jgi:hypothetical protein
MIPNFGAIYYGPPAEHWNSQNAYITIGATRSQKLESPFFKVPNKSGLTLSFKSETEVNPKQYHSVQHMNLTKPWDTISHTAAPNKKQFSVLKSKCDNHICMVIMSWNIHLE